MISGDNRFVFVACSYNMSETIMQMMLSIAAQSYQNWKIIITDDVSNEQHLEKTITQIQKFYDFLGPEQKHKLTFYGNTRKKWEVENVLLMLKDCSDTDVVCRIDCDDWLVDNDCLAIINDLYKKTSAEAIWTAHRWGYTNQNISGPMPQDADVYKHPWCSSHLKTFRKHLINDVADENFRGEDGNYVRRAGDQAIYLPVLHRAKIKGYIPQVMYHYSIKTDDASIFHTDDAKFQKSEAEFIRRRGYVT